jgi:excisionase family DNA binding protein
LGRFDAVAFRDPGSARRAPANEPDWLTLGQAAKYLGVAQSTIRKWSDVGRVPAFYTPGGHRRYRRRDLDTFLERSGPGGASDRAGPLVLIVDDDERIREYVRVNLEMEGYTVREAGSAEEGLAELDQQSPDLILLDVMMPQVDGWEMLRRVQERHGVGAIPVIMFSGQTEGQAADATSRGAQGFIGKPFNPQQLIESTKQLLPA